MTLAEFTNQIKGFASFGHPEKVIYFGWFYHTQEQKTRFTQSELRHCYQVRNEEPPNLSQVLSRLLAKRPKVLLHDSQGYFLEHRARAKLDQQYGEHETTIALSQLLHTLPGKVADKAEALFLSEAISCYRHKAFRAAIIMAWNLAYDHLLRWIIADPARLSAFNQHIEARVGKKGSGLAISKREDYEALGEQEVLDICKLAKLFISNNTKKILDIQLTKRNLAAHPSLISIEGPQADDTISSLVNNVVLELL